MQPLRRRVVLVRKVDGIEELAPNIFLYYVRMHRHMYVASNNDHFLKDELIFYYTMKGLERKQKSKSNVIEKTSGL